MRPHTKGKHLNDQPTPDQILQVGMGFWPSKVLLSAVEMELFTDLAKGPQSRESIQGRMGLHPRASLDFLDSLVALGFLQRIDGHYSNTPETARRLLDSTTPAPTAKAG